MYFELFSVGQYETSLPFSLSCTHYHIQPQHSYFVDQRDYSALYSQCAVQMVMIQSVVIMETARLLLKR